MGAERHKTEVELVEVAASTPDPHDRAPVPTHRARWTVVVLLVVIAVLASSIVLDGLAERRHRESLAFLVASGVALADVGPGLGPRWRVEHPQPDEAWIDDGVLVTVAQVRGSQVVQGRDLETGAELWRSTFASRLGTSRCTGRLGDAGEPLGGDEGDEPMLVCALRANPRLLGTDEGGTDLHVRSARTGQVLAERRDDAALAGARIVGPDLLAVWADDGELEVRREDARTGAVRWRLALATHEPVLASVWIEVDAVAGLLLVGTPREVFAVDPAGFVVFSHNVPPPRQPMRLAVRPVGDELFAVWQRRGRAWLPADLRGADGRVVLAGVGSPRAIAADDGSLGELLLTRHPDGDIVWDLGTRTKLWLARGEVRAAVVVGGLVVLETDAGLEGVDPRRRAPLWRTTDAEQVLGITTTGEVVATVPGETLILVGIDPATGSELWRAVTRLREPVRATVVDGALLAVQPRALSLLAVPDG